MKTVSPEQAGISSAAVLRFYKYLEGSNLSIHSVILARGNAIFSECYYAPFHKDFLHRMYSVSKSFVSVAIGLCEEDGLLSLDDPLIKYFPEHREGRNEKQQHADTTLRDLLKMESSLEGGPFWFADRAPDRTALYFKDEDEKLPGTLWEYDSTGSFMLGAVVERVTGKPLLTYLRERVLDAIGFSREAYFLTCPGGHSFGDSGLMCRSRDLLLFARFVLNGGTFDGVRYMNEAYLKKATDCQVCNGDFGFLSHIGFGYGYQFWGMPNGGFAMLGMGNQIALCDPSHDFIFIMNADNQGLTSNYEQILAGLYLLVIGELSENGTPLPEHPEAYSALLQKTSSAALFSLPKSTPAPFFADVTDKVFLAEENPMGISYIRLTLSNEEGVLFYKNAQGEKSLPFGIGKNVFSLFPEEGYSDLVAGEAAEGNRYLCAASADFPEEKKLRLRVQIIDKYFGNLAITLSFRDEDTLSLRARKVAEDFLSSYEGRLIAHAK